MNYYGGLILVLQENGTLWDLLHYASNVVRKQKKSEYGGVCGRRGPDFVNRDHQCGCERERAQMFTVWVCVAFPPCQKM